MNRLTALALALAASASLAEESACVAMLRATGGPEIEILGPKGERLGRAVSPGWSLALADGVPQISRITESQALVVWYGKAGAAASILEASNGTVREVWSDAFEAGWSIQAARDFNKDRRPDFLMVRSKGEGDGRSYECAVAVWDPEKGIDLVTDPVTVVPQCRGAYFATGDMDGDGAADVVFHSFDYGGSYETSLYMLKGRGDGTIDAVSKKVLILESPFAASTPILEDFDGDGDLDVFLPPDDDVDDEGQCHIAFNKGDGHMEKLAASIDLVPGNETSSGDTFFAAGFAADTNGDGRPDLVLRSDFIQEKAWEIRVHGGLGGGGFDAAGTDLASGEYGKSPNVAVAWIGWPGRDRQAPAGEAPAAKEMESWRAALGSAKPREAARAMGAFLRSGAAAAPFLVSLAPGKAAIDEARIRGLIQELDSDEPDVREKATQALIEVADVAEPLFVEALGANPSAEVAARIQQIRRAPWSGSLADLPPAELGQLRLLALLEALDTPETREVLGRFVQPDSSAALRRAAGDALRRRPR